MGDDPMSNISDKIRAALYHDNAVIFPDLMRGTVWSRADSGAFSKKMDDMHGTMRVGMFVEHMEEWFQRHPDATDEQVKASAKRIAAFIGSNLSFFKSLRLLGKLLKRTDLQTSLEQ
jgi:hypothetical protein